MRRRLLIGLGVFAALIFGVLIGRFSKPAKVTDKTVEVVKMDESRALKAEAQVRDLVSQIAELKSKRRTITERTFTPAGVPATERIDETAESDSKTATSTDTTTTVKADEHSVKTVEEERKSMHVVEDQGRLILFGTLGVKPTTRDISFGPEVAVRAAGPLWLKLGAQIPTTTPKETLVTVGLGLGF